MPMFPHQLARGTECCTNWPSAAIYIEDQESRAIAATQPYAAVIGDEVLAGEKRLLEQKESKPRDLPQSLNGIRGSLYGHGQRITSTSENFRGHVLVIIGRGLTFNGVQRQRITRAAREDLPDRALWLAANHGCPCSLTRGQGDSHNFCGPHGQRHSNLSGSDGWINRDKAPPSIRGWVNILIIYHLPDQYNPKRHRSVHYHSTTDDGSPLKTHRFYGGGSPPYDPHACHEAVTSPTRKRLGKSQWILPLKQPPLGLHSMLGYQMVEWEMG
ncbi:hypothetical protein TESG_06331 [Trichophyton tonsurans CBS 112818]|uniref:Uncharacterized protein n=1 Tax=Trichophyton tonsurans (strain CBS 112818) TaxID=647933 RepID=F2S5W9_TRIT1|nr:hypothetical protein TESG_06331 [Trichophyton tonsurans CBS 112818]